MTDTRETILALARTTVQAHGYAGLSFRELAKAIGVKSASIHYHFPTKGDLGAALARRYCEDATATLDKIWAETPDLALRLRRYIGVFRRALENENRMCMCGFMAAEYDDMPEAIRIELRAFRDINVDWLAKILAGAKSQQAAQCKQKALAIYAAVAGAQLTARSCGEIAVFDEIVEGYRAAGLIPS